MDWPNFPACFSITACFKGTTFLPEMARLRVPTNGLIIPPLSAVLTPSLSPSLHEPSPSFFNWKNCARSSSHYRHTRCIVALIVRCLQTREKLAIVLWDTPSASTRGPAQALPWPHLWGGVPSLPPTGEQKKNCRAISTTTLPQV